MPQDPATAWAWLQAEADATAELGAATHFPVPRPVAAGEPGHGYPMPWAVQTWLPGVTAIGDDPGDSEGFAHDLADLIAEVRSINPRGRTFCGTGRGGDLRDLRVRPRVPGPIAPTCSTYAASLRCGSGCATCLARHRTR